MFLLNVLLASCLHAGSMLNLFSDPEDGGDIFLRNVLLATCLHAGSMLNLFSDPEDGDDMFLRNVLLATCLHAVSMLNLFPTLKMEAIRSSETFCLPPACTLVPC
jgi:hypothetical protein